MDRFDLWGSLSAGLLSGLSRETRLSWAHVAARLPGIGEKGQAFLDLSSRLTKIETDLAQSLSSAVRGGTYKDIEQLYSDGLSKLLYEPLPPSNTIEGRIEENERFFGRPPSASEEVGLLYDYFFASVVDRGSASIIPELVDDIVPKAFERSTTVGRLSSKAPSPDGSPKGKPKNDADRRREAVKIFVKKLAPELQQLATKRDALRQEAIKTIEQQRNDRLGEVKALETLPEFTAADVLGKLLIERSQERIESAVTEARNEIEQSANRPDARQFVSSVLAEKLRWIDDRFGQQYRDTLASLKSEYQTWTNVRRDLVLGPIRVIDLSENLRRGELRREIVAGSVQCVIDACGVKRVRYSPPEASGPPPNFMNWIAVDEARKPDQSDPAETADQSRRVEE